jgi:hypothetical protein
MMPPGGWYSAPMIGCSASSETRIAGASFCTSSGPMSRESIPAKRLTSARLAMTNIARSVWASVRWPHWLNSRLKFSSFDRPS